METLAGRRAVITGAGRGIGAAIALKFAKEGASVVLAARSKDELDTVVYQITAAGGVAFAIPTDMGNMTEVEQLATSAVERLGGVDIVVSNAAYPGGPWASVVDMHLEEWEKTQRINVVGPLMLLKTLAPYLARGNGANAIIISSIRGLAGAPHGAAYGASKAVLNHLTQTLAGEWGPLGIRVNAILPGPVDTEMARAGLKDNQKLFDYFGNIAPLAGWTLAEDIAGPALFLASDAARKITGHLLVVDGGLKAINQDAFPPPVELTSI